MKFLKKLFHDNVKINSQQTRNAENLVSLAKFTAITSQSSAFRLFPQLESASKIRSWDFFCTVLATWSALLKIKTFVKDIKFANELQELVFIKLKEFHPSAVDAYDDFDNFLINHLKNQSQSVINPEVVKTIAGLWIVWNLTEKQSIQDERAIVSVLGEVFFTGFAFYFEEK